MNNTLKPLFKSLITFTFFAFLINSCTKLDVQNSGLDKDNFAKKFFSTTKIVTPQVEGIIELLKRENSRSGFVEKMAVEYGLPIWEKAAYGLNSSSSNSFTGGITVGNDIYVPLTINYYGLSAVMVAQWQTDSFKIKFYSKDYLYNVCHASAIDTAKAQNLLTLFFAMENYCFGTTDFYHIPASLFQKSTEVDSDGDRIIRIKDNSLNQSTNSFIHCVTFYHCINISPCTGWYCDRCPLCETTICHNHDDPPPGGGGGTGGGGTGGGGTGGGGGGTGGGGGCSSPFYLVDPCDDPPNNPPLTPCQKAYQACQAATDLFRRTEMQNRKAEMTSNFLPNREKAFWFGKINPTDTAYTTTNILTGDTGISISITQYPPASLGMQFHETHGAAHAHTTNGFPAPSAGDMYNYATLHSQNSNFKYFIFSPGANDYSLVVSDSIALANFSLNWPFYTYFDTTIGDWMKNTEIFEKNNSVFEYFRDVGNKTEEEAMELAQAFIAYQYQTGITIAKMDAQGIFKPIFVKEMPDPLNPAKKIYQQTSVCNLNTIIIE